MISEHGRRNAVATGLVAQVLVAALVAAFAPRLVVSTLHASVWTVLEGAAAGAALYLVLRRLLAPPPAPASAVAPPARSLAFRGLAVTVVAWAEETLWRGVLLGVLSARSTAFALVLSTAGFAASHVYGQGWPALRTHALTGITFGGLYVATGSLAAAIAAHAVYNLFVVATSAASPKGALP